MRKILITGENSYIGNHIQAWLEQYGDYYTVLQVDVISDEWEHIDFSDFDVIIHVAGIVHHPEITDWSVYEKVNVDLPSKIAQKAQANGVRLFIFMSTMAVYGIGKKLKRNIIVSDTTISPVSEYGRSKYLAEEKLQRLENETFKIAIVRPPNVYGKGCKGNYIQMFTSMVKKLPIIPAAYENVRQSMLYIDNLTEFIRLLIESGKSGVYMPQDDKTVSATELMQYLSYGVGKKGKKSTLLGLAIYCLSFIPIVKKAYGGVEYSAELSNCFGNKYQVVSIIEALKRTVKNE